MVLTSRSIASRYQEKKKIVIVYFSNKKNFCFWWFWRGGELLCTSSWNRFACSVPASSQLWAYFDLITGNLPLRPWSRLVRGWKYKQLVVKAAMAASLVPPPENISLHKVGLQQGHRLKLYSFDCQHQHFSMKKKNNDNDNEEEIKWHDFPWFGNFDCPELFCGWHKLGTRCRFFWTAPGLAIFGNLWQSAFQRRSKVRQVANNKRYVSYGVRCHFQLGNQKFWHFCISTKVQSKTSC